MQNSVKIFLTYCTVQYFIVIETNVYHNSVYYDEHYLTMHLV